MYNLTQMLFFTDSYLLQKSNNFTRETVQIKCCVKRRNSSKDCNWRQHSWCHVCPYGGDQDQVCTTSPETHTPSPLISSSPEIPQ